MLALRALARIFPNLKLPGWVPLAGDIDGRLWAPPVEIDDKRFGSSMTIPAILEIRVDGRQGQTTPGVLKPVAERLFKDYPPFHFNVSFACGRAPATGPGVYGDPGTHWFNVFVGYYQIDVRCDEWTRPFGYELDGRIVADDLARLGEADWNYFSNFMYGVPLSTITKVDNPDSTARQLPQVRIGERRWDHLEVTGMKVASAYVAEGGEQLVDNDPVLGDVWRCVFGAPYVGTNPATSFIATPMRARLYSCFRREESDRDLKGPVYRTYIFGGTVNEWWAAQADGRETLNAEFMALQMRAIEDLIVREFSHLGFGS